MSSNSHSFNLYAGTYTKRESHVHGKGQGIYRLKFDPISGAINQLECIAEEINPIYFDFSRNREYLFTVNEHWFDLGPEGTISSFAVEEPSCSLTLLNRKSSGGLAPCFISVDEHDQFLFVANYQTGEIATYSIQEGGQIGEVADLHHLGGSGPHEDQDGPHPHCILTDPWNTNVIVANLGADEILIYRLEVVAGRPFLKDPLTFSTEPGDGPRLVKFHPEGSIAYVINELSSTINTFQYDCNRARLDPVQRISTLPASYQGKNTCADLQVAPSGAYLYGSNRGHDSIAIFAVNGLTGELDLVDIVSSGGRSPRSFCIDPAGRFLLVANQDSDKIVSFSIDTGSGMIHQTGHEVEVPTPAFVTFYYGSPL